METWKKRSALFLTSQSISLFGSSLVQFAIVWYVTLETSSGAWVAALSICAFLPQFIVSFFSGVWADRYNKKMLIILADGAIAAATLGLALLFPRIGEGEAVLWALLVASGIRSVGTGVQTPAVNAVVPCIVPEDVLMRFNGINSTLQSVVQFAAPAAAGAVLAVSTLENALYIDIFTAAAGIGLLCLVAIPFKRQEKSEKTSMLSEMKQGFLYAVKKPFIGKMLLVFGLFIFLCVPAGFMSSLFVSRFYGGSYLNLTLVEIVGFAGMAAGGVLISAWGGFKSRVKTLLLGIALFGVITVLMGVADSLVIYLILMAIYGIAITMVQTASTTILQESTHESMQGRVFGLYGAMYSGFLPLGMAVFGAMADAVSMRLLMVVTGAALLVMFGVLAQNKSFRSGS